MMRGKLLGIDHGEKRIGLAVSDATGLVARELAIIRCASDAEDLRRINQLAAEHQVIGQVGLPSNDAAWRICDTVRKGPSDSTIHCAADHSVTSS
jgi:RNase H-fold protein (predicted Holliday junction resolvase)